MQISALNPYFDVPLCMTGLPATCHYADGSEEPYTGGRTRKEVWYFMRANPGVRIGVERCKLIDGRRLIIMIGLDATEDTVEYLPTLSHYAHVA